VTLHGITWDHTRGYVSLVAASSAFAERSGGVDVVWDRRSLWAFGEGSIEELAEAYDLLVVDHPFIGFAAERELLVPVDELLPAEYLRDQEANSVGPSYRSYSYGGHQWALAIDASGQTSAARPDLMQKLGTDEPATWVEVVGLARRTGAVAMPLAPVDALSAFFTFCAQAGKPAFGAGSGGSVVDRRTGREALERLKELADALDPGCLGMNPIRILSEMSRGDRIAYAPLTYAYSNYSRRGYAPNLLSFGPAPGGSGTTLGGAGLAVSARTPARKHAVALARWVAGEECQRTLYVLSGGQPGHRAAWTDGVANEITAGFFGKVLSVLDSAYLRPNHDGFAQFQAQAATTVHDFLDGGGDPDAVLDGLDRLYEPHRPRSGAPG
jgi:multiple sugar transport system substrate-binding protein